MHDVIPPGDAELYCEIHGTGEPLVLLHGGGGAGANWKLIFDFDSPPVNTSSRFTRRAIDAARTSTRSDRASQPYQIRRRLQRGIGEVDLVRLLRVGIPVELAGGQRLFVGVVPPTSSIVGTTIARTGRSIAGVETNIIAIIRQDHMIVPHADTVFQPRDGLVLVAAEESLPQLGKQLELW